MTQIDQIRKLQQKLQLSGLDNYTVAVCQLALGEQVNFAGLSCVDEGDLRRTYGKPGYDTLSWNREKATADAFQKAVGTPGTRTRRYPSMMRTAGRMHRAARRDVERRSAKGQPVTLTALNKEYIATALRYLHESYSHIRFAPFGKRPSDYMNRRVD